MLIFSRKLLVGLFSLLWIIYCRSLYWKIYTQSRTSARGIRGLMFSYLSGSDSPTHPKKKALLRVHRDTSPMNAYATSISRSPRYTLVGLYVQHNLSTNSLALSTMVLPQEPTFS